MSYNANYSGTIEAKTEESVGKILEIAGKNNTLNPGVWDIGITIINIHSYSNYNRYEILQFYKEITPYVKKVEIFLEGNDGQLWKHTYTEDEGWIEYQAQTIFVNPKKIV